MSEYPPLPIVPEWTPPEREFHKQAKEYIEGELGGENSGASLAERIATLEADETQVVPGAIIQRVASTMTNFGTNASFAVNPPATEALFNETLTTTGPSEIWVRCSVVSLTTFNSFPGTTFTLEFNGADGQSFAVDSYANAIITTNLEFKVLAPDAGEHTVKINAAPLIPTDFRTNNSNAIFEEIRT